MSAEKICPLACPEHYSAERSGSAFARKSGDYKELKTIASWRVYTRTADVNDANIITSLWLTRLVVNNVHKFVNNALVFCVYSYD